jgi:hypothetical protein
MEREKRLRSASVHFSYSEVSKTPDRVRLPQIQGIYLQLAFRWKTVIDPKIGRALAWVCIFQDILMRQLELKPLPFDDETFK